RSLALYPLYTQAYLLSFTSSASPPHPHPFPTRRSSDLYEPVASRKGGAGALVHQLRLSFIVYHARLLRTIEHLPYLAQQRVRRERLLEEGDACLEHTVAHDHIIGVARQVEHFEAGLQRREALCQLAPPHLGHDHVGHQEVDRPGVLRRQLDAVPPGCGEQQLVAVLLEHATREVAHGGCVFREQNGLGAARGAGGGGAGDDRLPAWLDPWQGGFA